MENRVYLSVVAPVTLSVPPSGGGFNFTLSTYDATNWVDSTNNSYFSPANVTISGQITGLQTGDDEITIAFKIGTQLATIIEQNGATFKGVPRSVPAGAAATFRTIRTDHVLNLFSESQFRFTISGDTTGIILDISDEPTLCTVAFAKQYGKVYGQLWIDYSTGATLSNTDIAAALRMMSAELIMECRNPIVMSGFVHEMMTRGTSGTWLRHRPVVYVDMPHILSAHFLSFLSIPIIDVLSAYFIESRNGYIDYRFHQDFVEAFEPFDEGNIFRMSYVAGFKQIPDAIKIAILRLSTISDFDPRIGELQGGTSRFKQGMNIMELRKLYFSPLRAFFRGSIF